MAYGRAFCGTADRDARENKRICYKVGNVVGDFRKLYIVLYFPLVCSIIIKEK